MDDVLDLVCTHTAEVLDEDAADIDPDLTFQDLGLDSLTAVELRDRLDMTTGLRLPSSLVFDYPTPTALADYLRSRRDSTQSGKAHPSGKSPALDDDPVVIVGMGCRFPGSVRSPEELWELVSSGGEAISELPRDRGWDLEELFDPDPDRPGTLYVRGGGFLNRADEFDAEFFGISPREALAMDPQQRLLLEVSWEALERAGIDPSALRGSETGVYTGLASFDYPSIVRDVPDIEHFYSTGTQASVASGRVAYALGFEGPAMTVDTACSASLVAVHLAVRALRAGECSMALAGGATVLAGPSVYLDFCRQRALSADGRCRAFAEGADGFGPAEGVGVLVLERLSDARRRGHDVWAVVRGSAVNQDGASNGLTAPNGPSQQRVISRALQAAGLDVADVDVVEAHGTGTPLGDPIEAQALLATYGQRDPDAPPLLLGSVKSNIGHAQAAAGIAGVIKSVQALRHAVVPATLHVDRPTSHVDWDAGAVRLVTETVPWPQVGRPRRVGVSAFGMSGTNAHVILEQAPCDELAHATSAARGTAPERTGVVPLTVSGRSAEALRAQADALAAYLETRPDGDLPSIATGLIRGRAAFEHRAVVPARGHADALAGLRAVAAGEETPDAVTGTAMRHPAPVFVFPGQGSQWAGMGRELLAQSPVFGKWIDHCEEAFAPYVDWSLRQVLRGEAGLERVDVVQPALFAVLTGIARLWEHHGVAPAAVVGHSQGEIAAACVAGALSLEDAARIVVLRSQALAALAGTGGMATVMAPRATAESMIGRWAGRLWVAAVNGPSSTVVSGDADAIEEFLRHAGATDVWARRVPVDYASHSPHIERVREQLADALRHVTPRAARVPFYSTLTGGPFDTTGLDADYWYRNLRHPVEFDAAVRALLDDGHRMLIETSPHPVLTTALEQTVDDSGRPAAVLDSLRRDQAGPGHVAAALARAYVHGAPVDLETLLPDPVPSGVPHDLPTYAFQRRRYWPSVQTARGRDRDTVVEHAESGGVLLTSRLGLDTHPWLADHAVDGTPLLPGTALLDLALRAGVAAGCPRVAELTMDSPLLLHSGSAVQVQAWVGAADADGHRPVTIHSRPADAPPGTPWTRHAQGEVTAGTAASASCMPDTSWPPAGAEPVSLTDFYARAAGRGYDYGPAFRGLRALWRRGDEFFAQAALPRAAGGDVRTYALHPALLDAALHPVGLDSEGLRLPFSWQGVDCRAVGATQLRVRVAAAGPHAVSVQAMGEDGRTVASVESLALRPVTAEQLDTVRQAHQDTLLHLDWQPVRTAGADPGRHTLAVLGSDRGHPGAERHATLAALRQALDAGAAVPDLVYAPFEPGPAGHAVAEPTCRALTLIQEWLADERLASSRLVVVTRRAVATRPDEDVLDLSHAPLWGLVRSAQAEHPGRFVLLDLDEPQVPAALLALPGSSAEPQLAVRQGRLLVPRLARTTGARTRGPGRLDPDGTVLITGGFGLLGGLTAKRLVQLHGARHLLLVSRKGADTPGAAELIRELTSLGARVTAKACDVGDREALHHVLGTVAADHPLTAVVHTAGLLDDGLIGSLDRDGVERVFRPKAEAALHLHELTKNMNLALFALFSSAAGILGAAGQANYAAANTYLDALAQHRRARGLPATSLAWGHWEQAGHMTAHLGRADLARLSAMGMAPMPTEAGLALFDAAVASAAPVLVAARVRTAGLPTPVPPLFRELAGAGAAADRSGYTGDPDALRERLAALPRAEREGELLTLVRTQIAAVLGHPSGAAVPADRTLHDLGVDSLGAVQLRNGIGRALAERLPATVVFDHPTADALSRFLAARIQGEESGPDSPTHGAALTEDTVASASDEELFALLDAELGTSDEETRDG
ncbi:hypothetical protein GCM10010129_57070 [Streptomyces fumigatiscleroticus]|nr:hypothetical protein GCM10010129_57070 [Streptomyces fumigatiscleroticus]